MHTQIIAIRIQNNPMQLSEPMKKKIVASLIPFPPLTSNYLSKYTKTLQTSVPQWDTKTQNMKTRYTIKLERHTNTLPDLVLTNF